jgi:hypothetical protein
VVEGGADDDGDVVVGRGLVVLGGAVVDGAVEGGTLVGGTVVEAGGSATAAPATMHEHATAMPMTAEIRRRRMSLSGGGEHVEGLQSGTTESKIAVGRQARAPAGGRGVRKVPWTHGGSRVFVFAAAAAALSVLVPIAGPHGLPTAGAVAECTPPPPQLGLDAYTHLDALPFLDLTTRAASATTADPGGGNLDSSNTLGSVAGGNGRVLMREAGPGIVTFLRMQENWGGPWNMDVDGAESTITADDLGTDHVGARFPYPLSLGPEQSSGSSIVAAPIPFAKSFQFASSGRNGNFYALYRKLPLGSEVPSSATTPAVVAGLLRASPAERPSARATTRSGSARVAARERTITTIGDGPREIQSLRLQIPAEAVQSFADARVRIYWDGERSPSVDAPIKYLAGAGGDMTQHGSEHIVRTMFTSVSSDPAHVQFAIRWPMPFASRARIAIVPAERASPVRLRWAVRSAPFAAPRAWWGTFRATYTAIDHPLRGQDNTFLDVTGSGRIVGTVVDFGRPGETLEGDPSFALDGSRTPQVTLTGTEEWGLGGNYWRNGQGRTLPLGGMSTVGAGASPGGGSFLYRYLVADSMPFNSRAVVRWEHGGVDDVDQAYRALVLWYGSPRSTARHTDTILPADATSASAHGLQLGPHTLERVDAGFTYGVTSTRVERSLITTAAPLRFTMQVDPRNVGVLVRRVFDTAVADQAAVVSVDGIALGTWSEPGSFARPGADGVVRRWQEDEVMLPASATAGKRRITIELAPVSDGLAHRSWTTAEVQTLSMVPPCGPAARVKS